MHHLQDSRRFVAGLVLALALSGAPWAAPSAAKHDGPVQRARPPKWSANVLDTFFQDARQQLVGTRPDFSARRNTTATSAAPAQRSDTRPATWPTLLDAETIETEIKRLAQAVNDDVTTPGEFKGGKYKDCRRHFSMLAMLFAVVTEYDGQVRWQDGSAGLRDSFARAGRNCKVGTDQTFREAAERKQDLVDLIRGSRPQVPAAETVSDWSQVAGRSPLMQRINSGHQDRLVKWLATEREFADHRGAALHEAQIVAAIAEVIQRKGFEFWDDEQYAAYARELEQSAGDVAAAAQQDDFQKARAAVSRMTKTCADCHDGYRE